MSVTFLVSTATGHNTADGCELTIPDVFDWDTESQVRAVLESADTDPLVISAVLDTLARYSFAVLVAQRSGAVRHRPLTNKAH